MAKAFSLLSWNVEHFKNSNARVERVADLLKQEQPDAFALYEVEGKEVFEALVSKMPNYSFHITEGPQVQEILVGVRSTLTAFFTQKVAFKAGVSLLRPGALLTITINNVNYSILFLHTKSKSDPRGMGLRDEMMVRACKFRRTLDKAAGGEGNANYLFLGDLNTMGMRYRYVSERSIPYDDELRKLEEEAVRKGMRVLDKDEPKTWSNGSASSMRPSNLDHVVAAEHLEFRSFGGSDVTVRGWPKQATTAAQDKWIRDYSDHAYLYMEVQKV